jgi:hypothetical protein
LNTAELNNFLKARGVDKPCPACGHEKFAPVEGEVDLALPVDRQPGKFVIAAALACENCGFLRLHGLAAADYSWPGREGKGA